MLIGTKIIGKPLGIFPILRYMNIYWILHILNILDVLKNGNCKGFGEICKKVQQEISFKKKKHGVTKRCRLSLLIAPIAPRRLNSAPHIRVQMRGSCGVSAKEYSCAHHVTWSPNKLWRSTSIFNLWKKWIKKSVGFSVRFFTYSSYVLGTLNLFPLEVLPAVSVHLPGVLLEDGAAEGLYQRVRGGTHHLPRQEQSQGSHR